MFKKILVAIDGSDMSNKAVEIALNMALEQKSKITFIHVGKLLAIPDGMILDSIDELYESIRKNGQELLKRGKWLADSNVIDVETIYAEGDPASEIIKVAKEGMYQLIVLGSRGLGSFKELMLGSVSHRVSQIAPCPVLIVK